VLKQVTFQDLKKEKRRGAASFQGSLERLGVRKKKEEAMIFLFIVV
jgi:predicted CopG family antitoxin